MQGVCREMSRHFYLLTLSVVVPEFFGICGPAWTMGREGAAYNMGLAFAVATPVRRPGCPVAHTVALSLSAVSFVVLTLPLILMFCGWALALAISPSAFPNGEVKYGLLNFLVAKTT